MSGGSRVYTARLAAESNNRLVGTYVYDALIDQGSANASDVAPMSMTRMEHRPE